ncbi:MAG: hypothetical protein ACLU38_09335 [Dysosmobacter sp.]
MTGITVFGHRPREQGGRLSQAPRCLSTWWTACCTSRAISTRPTASCGRTKNRFGATNEIGVFEMMDWGLKEVENPSEMLLSGRPKDAPGTCVTCAMEGARPVLAEVQTLIAPASAANPRRMSNGFDYNRFAMLLAVLEKRGV